MVSPLSYDPFRPPGAIHTYTFVPDHPAYRPEQKGPTQGPTAPAGASQVLPPVVSGNAVPSPGPSVRPAHVLLPVKTAPPPAAAPNFAPAFTPPGARPERLQSFG